ncbi:hypothetical protein FB566_2309 [Stackebrandtia endophytica]|uniref:Uncharacterized protein n=1 Tax=Stackebrandtia endophytica TaxID=1496996 RepID=A0A543AW44_9ACTN|nr:hypothetical protein [Stackebrandtia endophytica]TQL76772.1 hypothetical protein FB566_2309 [Stackebrandtia endophytica]
MKLPERHVRTLTGFERTAERVFTTELARREDATRLGRELQLGFGTDSETGDVAAQRLRLPSPAAKPVALALQLLRPLTTCVDHNEPMWSEVMSALDFHRPPDDMAITERVSTLRDRWARYPAPRLQFTLSAETTDEESHDEPARRFLHGDLGDGELLAALEDDHIRYAACSVVSDGFLLVNSTYQVLHRLRRDIAPEDGYFSRRLRDRAAAMGFQWSAME